jgi:PAS domain S-box-containing protein
VQKSRSLVFVALVISAAVLIAAGLGAYRAVRVLTDASDQLLRSKDTSLALEQTLSALRDAETGQRGYLLASRQEYLAPYHAALEQIQERLSRLQSLTARDANAAHNFAELQRLSQAKLNELAETIRLHDAGDQAAAMRVVLTNAGQHIMEQIRVLVDTIQQAEQARYARYLQREREGRELSAISGWATSALAIALLGVLVIVVRRDTARLRASEERLVTTLRSIGDAVIATDQQGRITMMNPVAEALTGWRLSMARGASLEQVFRIINEETRDRVESPVAKVLRVGGIVGLANPTVLIRRDGHERPIEDSGAPILDGKHTTLGVVLVFRDASHERAAARALREADRRKDEFLATLAHELRNPLAPIRQAAQIVRTPGATDAQIRWSHEVIERQVQNMTRLLDDLLDISRITRGTLEARMETVDLNAVLEAAVELARPTVDARRHLLSVECPENMPLYVDPLRLAQVIANLLTNSAKYTEAGGRIQLSAQREGEELAIAVSDNGVGIGAEMLPRVFDMFVQARSVVDRSDGGLGIGLSLAQGLAALHGGRIEAHSPGLGKGSTFTVRIPLMPAAARRLERAARQQLDLTAQKSARVLVADDNPDTAESLATLLQMHGHDVQAVHDGEAALRALESFQPDFALLDIGMPKLNGYEVARRTRRAAWGQRIRLIALTGWGQEQNRREALASGFDHHFVKPVQPAELMQYLSGSAGSG